MDPKKLNSYVGVVNQPPPKWSSVKKWLLHINYAPGYAPEPEQKPVCRQFSRCEGCPYPAHGFLCWGGEDDCMRTRAMHCMQQKHLHYCVDIDIKSFFDTPTWSLPATVTLLSGRRTSARTMLFCAPWTASLTMLWSLPLRERASGAGSWRRLPCVLLLAHRLTHSRPGKQYCLGAGYP